MLPLLLLLLLLSSSPHSSATSHRDLLLLTFSHVSNFRPPPPSTSGDHILHLHLPSQNLSGTLSWTFLRNITTLQTLDLSNNSLSGSIPTTFWSSPSLSTVNLARNNLGGPIRFPKSPLSSLNLSQNRFTSISNISLLSSLKTLDLSQNRIFFAPPGLNTLNSLEYLDLSQNSMSCNNLTAKGGVFSHGETKGKRKKEKKGILAVAGIGIVGAVLGGVLWSWRRRKGGKEERGEKGEEWVREAKWGAEVVVFEKPLLELRFGDLAEATCGFGREALMAEKGRIGAVYRAVLDGDLDVVVRVMEREREVEGAAAEAAFREVGKLRHRNILPLLGYCIAGLLVGFLFEGVIAGLLNCRSVFFLM